MLNFTRWHSPLLSRKSPMSTNGNQPTDANLADLQIRPMCGKMRPNPAETGHE